jgi:hypothetical protein
MVDVPPAEPGDVSRGEVSGDGVEVVGALGAATGE